MFDEMQAIRANEAESHIENYYRGSKTNLTKLSKNRLWRRSCFVASESLLMFTATKTAKSV